jgi:hypothetical protein
MFWVKPVDRNLFVAMCFGRLQPFIDLRHANKQIPNKNVCLVDLGTKNPS